MTRRDINEGDTFRKGFATNALEDGATTGQVPAVAADGQVEFVDAGGGSQPEGSLVPVARPDGATVDDTTYDDTWFHSGKFTTLILPDTGKTAVAMAIEGDAFPRTIMVNPVDGFYYGDGTVDPIIYGPAMWIEGPDVNGFYRWVLEAGKDFVQQIRHGDFDANAGYRTHFPTGIAIQADTINAEPVTVSSGDGIPAIGGNAGDCYLRKDGGDSSWLYRCTVAGVAGAATWVPYSGSLPDWWTIDDTPGEESIEFDGSAKVAPTGDGGVALTVKPAVSDNNNTYGLHIDATNGGTGAIKITPGSDVEATPVFSVDASGAIAGNTCNLVGGTLSVNNGATLIATFSPSSTELPGAAISMPNLPTADPLVAGVLWNSAGTLKVSAGPPGP